MAPLPAAANCVALDTHFTIGDDTHVMSRLHFRFPAAPSAADLQAMADGAHTAWTSSNLLNDLRQGNTVTQWVATSLFDNTMAQGINSTAVAGAQVAGSLLPAEASVVASYPIQRRYRGGHPRGYWPLGNSNNMASPQTWSQSAASGFQTDLRAYVNAIKAVAYSVAAPVQVSISYYSGATWHQSPTTGAWRRVATPRATPVVDNVTTINVGVRIGSQRRRMR